MYPRSRRTRVWWLTLASRWSSARDISTGLASPRSVMNVNRRMRNGWPNALSTLASRAFEEAMA
jgi:hypothetical protein